MLAGMSSINSLLSQHKVYKTASLLDNSFDDIKQNKIWISTDKLLLVFDGDGSDACFSNWFTCTSSKKKTLNHDVLSRGCKHIYV